MSKYNEGDKVRHLPSGEIGYLLDINGNENYLEEDEYWAELVNSPDLYNSTHSTEIGKESDVELIAKYSDIPPRKLPTRQEIAAAIEIDSFTFQHEETDFRDFNEIQIVARTADDLRFVAILKVVDVYETDF